MEITTRYDIDDKEDVNYVAWEIKEKFKLRSVNNVIVIVEETLEASDPEEVSDEVEQLSLLDHDLGEAIDLAQIPAAGEG